MKITYLPTGWLMLQFRRPSLTDQVRDVNTWREGGIQVNSSAILARPCFPGRRGTEVPEVYDRFSRLLLEESWGVQILAVPW